MGRPMEAKREAKEVSLCDTGNGILQSHAHVSAGCLYSFPLIKRGGSGSRGGAAPMPLTGLVFHKQIE